jgi:hypothetical protein
MVMDQIARQRGIAAWQLALTCCAVACASDPTCLGGGTCPSGEIADISVSAPDAPLGPVGLTMVITGPVYTPDQSTCGGGVTFPAGCGIIGAPGRYQVTLSAPGYQPSVVSFNEPPFGKPSACGCVSIEVQKISVVMQPVSDSRER